MRKSDPPRAVCRECSAVMTDDGRCEKCEAIAALRRRADAREDLATGEPAAAGREKGQRRKPPSERSETMAFQCVDGCGAKVSKKNGRCRTCAGLLRRNKSLIPKAARPASVDSPPGEAAGPAPANLPLGRSGAQIARHRREAPVQTSAAPPPAEAGAAVEDILAGLQVAGLRVKAVEVVSATGRVRFEVEPAREA